MENLLGRYTPCAWGFGFILFYFILLFFFFPPSLPNNMDFSIRDIPEPIPGRVWFN